MSVESRYSVLLDFEEAFKSKTGIPLSTVNDAICIVRTGASVALWITRKVENRAILDWVKSVFSVEEQSRVRILQNRPSNLKLWFYLLLGIKLNIESFDFMYQRLFIIAPKDKKNRVILRIDDPFGANNSPTKSFIKDLSNKLRLKFALARFLRTLGYKRVCANSQVIHVFNSHFTSNLWETIYSSGQESVVIYPPVQFSLNMRDKNAETVSISNRHPGELLALPYFVIVGGQRQRKDPAAILNAWSTREFSPRARIVVVGSIPTKYLTPTSREFVNSGLITFEQNLSETQLELLISRSIALIFNSRGEGFGNPIAEALYLGVPVICNDLEPFKEIGVTNTFFYRSNDFNHAMNLMNQKLELHNPRTHRSRLEDLPFTFAKSVDSWKKVLGIL